MEIDSKRFLRNSEVLQLCADWINKNYSNKYTKYTDSIISLEQTHKENKKKIEDANLSIISLLKGVAPPSKHIPVFDESRRVKATNFDNTIIDNKDIFDQRFAQKYKELEELYKRLNEELTLLKTGAQTGSQKIGEIYNKNRELDTQNKILITEFSAVKEENEKLKTANVILVQTNNNLITKNTENEQNKNLTNAENQKEMQKLEQQNLELKMKIKKNENDFFIKFSSQNLENQIKNAANKTIIDTINKKHAAEIAALNAEYTDKIQNIQSNLTLTQKTNLDFEVLKTEYEKNLQKVKENEEKIKLQLIESQNKVFELTNENRKLVTINNEQIDKCKQTLREEIIKLNNAININNNKFLDCNKKFMMYKLLSETYKTQLDDCNRELNECKSKLQNAPPVPSTPPIQYYDLIESNMFDDVIAKGKLDLNIKGGGHKLFMKGGTHRLYDDEQYVAISKSKATALKNMIEQYQTKFSTMNDQLKTFTRTLILSMTASAKLNKDHLSEKIANMANQSIVSLFKQANDDLKNANESIAQEKDNLTQANAKLEVEKTALEGEKKNLETDKKNLETDKKNLEAEKKNLEGDNATLKTENSTLTTQIKDLTNKATNASTIATGTSTALANAKASLQKFMSKDNRVMFEETKSSP